MPLNDLRLRHTNNTIPFLLGWRSYLNMSESSVSVSVSVSDAVPAVSGSSGASAGTKIVYAMNKCLIDFVRHVNPLDSELKKINKRQFKVIDKMSKEHMDLFRAQWIEGDANKTVLDTIRETACSALLSHPDVASRELLPNIKVSDMVLKVSEEELPIIRFYLYVFSLFAVMYTDVMQHAEASDKDEKDAVSDAADLATLSHVLKIVQQIQDGTYQKEEDILEEIIDEDLKSILVRMLENAMGDAASESEESKETMNGGMPEPNLDALQNTSIGALAKEISEDLDLSDLKIERPEDIFNMALGGGAGGGSGGSMVSSIISKVGTKIQEKMQKGELKQEDLLRDAFSFLNTFSGAGGGNGGGGNSRGAAGSGAAATANPMAAMLNNPMMQQMMSSMMGGGGMGGLGGLAASLGGMGGGQSSSHSSSATRDRLRKKYESKK
jgi:hypothetical protein